MNDVEVFKLILNGGSFALVVILVLWALFKASPAIQNMMIESDEKHSEAFKAISFDNRNTLTAMANAHQTAMNAMATANQIAMSAMAKEFREAMDTLHKECREERAELLKRSDENDKQDRESRHKQGELYQKSLAELHELYRNLAQRE